MLTLPDEAAKTLAEWGREHIPDKDLTGDGREDYLHTTALYGFPDTIKAADVLKHLPWGKPLSIKLGAIKRFAADDNRPDSDVIVVAVTSPELTALHEKLKDQFDVKSRYPGFNAHVTIAYVKPGTCKGLEGKEPMPDAEISGREMVYSLGKGNRTSIWLTEASEEEGKDRMHHFKWFCPVCDTLSSCRCTRSKHTIALRECYGCARKDETASADKQASPLLQMWKVLSRARTTRSALGRDAADMLTMQHLGSVFNVANKRFFNQAGQFGITRRTPPGKITDMLSSITPAAPPVAKPLQQSLLPFMDKLSSQSYILAPEKAASYTPGMDSYFRRQIKKAEWDRVWSPEENQQLAAQMRAEEDAVRQQSDELIQAQKDAPKGAVEAGGGHGAILGRAAESTGTIGGWFAPGVLPAQMLSAGLGFQRKMYMEPIAQARALAGVKGFENKGFASRLADVSYDRMVRPLQNFGRHTGHALWGDSSKPVQEVSRRTPQLYRHPDLIQDYSQSAKELMTNNWQPEGANGFQSWMSRKSVLPGAARGALSGLVGTGAALAGSLKNTFNGFDPGEYTDRDPAKPWEAPTWKPPGR